MSDRDALKIFSRQPVSNEMITFLAATTSSIIQVKATKPQYSIIPKGSNTSSSLLVAPHNKTTSLVTFIKNLIKYSNVQTPTLMATLVYLNKMRNILPANAVGMETTRHRIFLAALILSAKSLNDSSPLNKHWTKYTDGLLTNDEVNMAERELIGLLKWNVTVKEDELIIALQPFLSTIKQSLQQQMEEEHAQKANYYRASNAYSRYQYSIPTPAATPSPSSSSHSSPAFYAKKSASNSSISSYTSNLSLSNSHSSRSLQSSHSSYHNLATIALVEEEPSVLQIPQKTAPKRRVPLATKSANSLNISSSYDKQYKSHNITKVSKSSASSIFNLVKSGRITA
ncbi:uncharacterized protein RJT20DRAFT_12157 [Scheffersomyces xylosifermentans]|uniref:uncharacterized protein n=1 Tax=Scheffersomyces xylosifermentans TaxID=1304137 RepID=UPI00315DF4E3